MFWCKNAFFTTFESTIFRDFSYLMKRCLPTKNKTKQNKQTTQQTTQQTNKKQTKTKQTNILEYYIEWGEGKDTSA